MLLFHRYLAKAIREESDFDVTSPQRDRVFAQPSPGPRHTKNEISRTSKRRWLVNCPKCGSDLKPAVRRKVDVKLCSGCQGMWIERREFTQLENEAFRLDEHAKGTLVFSSTPTTAKCPECEALLKRFNYRLYDLELEFCENEHGFWLDAGEDAKVLEFMKKTESNIDRDMSAEDRWAGAMKHLHSGSFLDKVRDLLR